jgi:hypothetical protein
LQFVHLFFARGVVLKHIPGKYGMTDQYVWQEFYTAAMLELDPERVRQRINEAQEALAQRLEEIRKDGTGSEEERMALTDAQQNLRTLLRTLDLDNPRQGG